MTRLESLPAPQHVQAPDTARSGPGAGAAKGVFLPALVVLTIGTVFVSVYLAAFHAPRPHRLPVAVVGPGRAADRVQAGLDAGLPGGFAVHDYPDVTGARRALAHRTVYAAYLTDGGTARLLYAGANGAGVTATVTGAFGAVSAAHGQHLATQDVLPASPGDTRGLSIFYSGFGVVLAGFLFGLMTYQAAPRLDYGRRMVSLLLFGVLGGLMVELVAGRGFHAVPGPFLGVAGVSALVAVAVGATTMTLVRLFGPAGMSLSSMLLLILGNATGGGILPARYLPGWLYPLHAGLPVGAGIRSIQGLAYFHHDGLTSGVLVLIAWTVVCAAVIRLRDSRLLRRRPAVS